MRVAVNKKNEYVHYCAPSNEYLRGSHIKRLCWNFEKKNE